MRLIFVKFALSNKDSNSNENVFNIIFKLNYCFFNFCPRKYKVLLINTNVGDIVVELYNETPQHRDNFIKLAKSGYLNQSLFHRVIPGFMIQGGDPDSKNALPNVAIR
jgi:peptidyl-prolyl cis-trans isomerase B (cyclophilin B)